MAYNQNYGSPYGYPSYPNYPNYQQNNNINYYSVVNGLEGAKSYQLLANQTILLMDSNNPIVYKKTANGLGQASIECYKLVKISEQEASGAEEPKPQPDYALKSDILALQKKIDSLTKKMKKEERTLFDEEVAE